jgi:hypothetical protein
VIHDGGKTNTGNVQRLSQNSRCTILGEKVLNHSINQCIELSPLQHGDHSFPSDFRQPSMIIREVAVGLLRPIGE